MTDKLKNFIQEHHQDFDVVEPSSRLWTKIEAGMNEGTAPLISSKFLSALKYLGFSASVILVAFFLLRNKKEDQKRIDLSGKTEINSAASIVEGPSEVSPVNETKEETKDVNGSGSLQQETKAALAENTAEQLAMASSGASVNSNEMPVMLSSFPNPISPAQTYSEVFYQSASKGKNKNNTVIDTMFAGVKRLEINGSYFDISVVGSETEKITIHGEIGTETKGIVFNKKNANDFRIIYEKRDSVLVVSIERPCVNTVIIGSVRQRAHLNFAIPAATELLINNASGNIQTHGLKGKTCQIENKYGNVSVWDMQSNIDLRMVSGNILLKNTVGKIKAATKYGDQYYENISGNIDLVSTTGNIKVKGLGGNVNIASTFGDIHLSDSKGNAIIAAQSGDITGKNVELTDNAQFKTTFGDVKMDLKNNVNELSFDLKTTYGDLKINKGDQVLKSDEGKLSLSLGKIMVSGLSQSGDQYYE